MLVIGSRNAPNVDIRIEDPVVETTKKITEGRNSDTTFIYDDPMIPFAVGIIFGELYDFNLKEGNSYLSLNSEAIFSVLSRNLVDLAVVAPPQSPIVSGCTVFDKLHSEWGASGESEYVLKGPHNKDISLSRCVATTIRFLPKVYRISSPTPGHRNDCPNTADFEMSLPGGNSGDSSHRKGFIPILVPNAEHDALDTIEEDIGNLRQSSDFLNSRIPFIEDVGGLSEDDNPFIPFVGEESRILDSGELRENRKDDLWIPILSDRDELLVNITANRDGGPRRYRRMDPMEECMPNRPSQATSPMDQQPGNQPESQGTSTLVNYGRASRANDDLTKSGEQPKEYLWATLKYFKNLWLEQMEQYQKDTMPWEFLAGESGKGARYWVEYLYNAVEPALSTIRCWLCYNFHEAFLLRKGYKSGFASEEGKIMPRKAEFRREIMYHDETPGHQGVVKELMQEHVETLEQMFAILQQKEKTTKVLKKTANHIMTVYSAIMWNFPFSRYAELMQLQEHNEAVIGQFLRSRYAMRSTAIFLSEIADNNLSEYLLTENLPISILVDESTNSKHENFLIILIQIPQNHWPVVYFFDLVQVLSADADTLFGHILEAFEKRGLLDYLKSQLVAIASDGASVMVGKSSGLCQKFVQWAIEAVQCMHCMAHRTNLITKWGLKLEEWFGLLEDMSKKTYNLYKTGHKNMDSLINTANKMGVRIYAIRLLYDIRWISSLDRTFRNHVKNWKLYITDLRSPSRDKEGQAKANSLLDMWTSRKNMLAFFFGIDISAVFGEWSRALQFSGDLIFSKHREKSNVRKILKNLEENPGEMLKKFMDEVTCSGNLPVENKPGFFTYLEEKKGCSVHEITHAQTVTWQGIELSPPSETSAMPDLDEIRYATVENLLNEITYYFPEDDVLDNFSVLDPGLFPLDSSLVATYGEDKIVNVAKHLNPQSTPEYLSEVVNEWKTLMQQFLQEPSFSKDVKQLKTSLSAHFAGPKHFWFKYMQKLPEKFLFPAKIREIIDKSLSIPASTADAERGFSLMTAIVTKYRSNLALKIVAALMRIKWNGPPREKLPATDLARIFVEKNMRADDPSFNDDHLKKRPKLEKNTFDMGEEDDIDNNPNRNTGDSMIFAKKKKSRE